MVTGPEGERVGQPVDRRQAAIVVLVVGIEIVRCQRIQVAPVALQGFQDLPLVDWMGVLEPPDVDLPFRQSRVLPVMPAQNSRAVRAMQVMASLRVGPAHVWARLDHWRSKLSPYSRTNVAK